MDAIYYAGGTWRITAVFRDDQGQVITDFTGYDMDVLIYKETGDAEVLIEKADMTIDAETGVVTITIEPTDTKNFVGQTMIEVRVVQDGFTRIGQEYCIMVKKTRIKDK